MTHSPQTLVPPRSAVQLRLSPMFGWVAVPWCPHEGCGWSMPELWCPVHGNFGMTYLFAKSGSITWVKAVLA